MLACTFVVTSCFITGCGGQLYEYESGLETQNGPGVLSGEDGVFTIYGESKDKDAGSTRK